MIAKLLIAGAAMLFLVSCETLKKTTDTTPRPDLNDAPKKGYGGRSGHSSRINPSDTSGAALSIRPDHP